MYKFFLYSMLLFLYLGLAKFLSPSEMGIDYLQNEKTFSKLISGNHATAILTDTHATGFLIKTFYQKYRIISGLTVEDRIFRTSKEFAKKNLTHIGLALYAKNSEIETTTPSLPGMIYVDDREYGYWKERKNGQIVWVFNKTYKHYPKYLGWGKYRPDELTFQKFRSHLLTGEAFLGLNNEFGPEGSITKKYFPQFFKVERKKKINLQTMMVQFFKENF